MAVKLILVLLLGGLAGLLIVRLYRAVAPRDKDASDRRIQIGLAVFGSLVSAVTALLAGF